VAAKDNTQPSKSSNKSSKGKKETKKKNKKNKSNRKYQKQDEAWKKIPPKAGEAKQKIHKELTWYWCDNHIQWTIHTPADCKKLNLPFTHKFIQRVKFKIFTYIFQALLIIMKVDCCLHEHRRQRELLLAHHSMEPSKVTSCRFDTDSFSISVDNCASRTIANNIANFENLRSLTPIDSDNILGINGMVKVEKLGTFVFDIEDDDGQIHMIKINNSAYAPAHVQPHSVSC
jgi:hypothetical protein